MAWFRRWRDSQASEPAEGDDAQPAGETRADDVIRADRSHAGDWMALPPMATTVGPPPTTFRVQRLPEIMTTHRPTAVVGELGHHLSPAAPAGQVHGLATAAGPARVDHPSIDLPLRAAHHPPPEDVSPVQRATSSDTDPIDSHESMVARADMPVASQPVQRTLTATPPAATPPPPAVAARASLPEAAPIRVLREPAMPLAAAFNRPVPPASVVDGGPAPVTTAERSPSAPTPERFDGDEFVTPLAPVEFTVRSGDPVVTRPATGPVEDATPTIPLQRAADAATAWAADGSDTPNAGATGDPDMPLATRAPSTRADGDLMPPIQPRTLQRQSEAASPSPPTSAPTAGADRDPATGLPPLPQWARAAMGIEPPTEPGSPAMPLHGTSAGAPPAATVQRDAPAVQRDAPVPQPVAHAAGDEHGTPDEHGGTRDDPAHEPVSDAHDSTTPLVAANPLVEPDAAILRSFSPEASPDVTQVGRVDLPLHSAPAAPRVTGTAIQREVDAPTGSVEFAAHRAPNAAGEATTVPLLGSRPLQLQRAADVRHGGTTARPVASGDAVPSRLPLAADPVGGPALATTPALHVATAGHGPATTETSAVSGADRTSSATADVAVQTLSDVSRRRTPSEGAAARVPAEGASDMTLQEPVRGVTPDETRGYISDFAVATGLGRRTADGSVTYVPATNRGGASETIRALQREAAPVDDDNAPGPSGNGATHSRTEFVVQRGMMSQPSNRGNDAAVTERETDELAARIYDRIRWKLTADVRADERRFSAGHWNRKGR